MANIEILTRNDWTHPESGGGAVHLKEIFSRLADEHDIHILASSYPGAPKKEEIDGITIHRKGFNFRNNSLLNHLYLSLYFPIFHKKRNSDITFVNIYNTPWLIPLPTDSLPIFHLYHEGELVDAYGKFWGNLAQLFEKIGMWKNRGRNVISISENVTNGLMKRKHKEDKIHEIPNGVDVEEYQPRTNYDEPTVVFLGRLVEQKGADMLPEIIENTDDNINFHIAGRGKFQSEIEDLDDRFSNVTYHGYVSLDKKKELLSKSWLTLMPSTSEGLSLVFLESCASGTPVLASDVVGLQEAIEDGMDGFLVDRNPEDISMEIEKLVKMENLEEVGQNARDYAEKRSWESRADQFRELIDQFK